MDLELILPYGSQIGLIWFISSLNLDFMISLTLFRGFSLDVDIKTA